MDDQRSSVNFDSAVIWPFKLREKHYLPTHGFSKSPCAPRSMAAMTSLMWFRDDLRLHDNQALSRAAEAAPLGDKRKSPATHTLALWWVPTALKTRLSCAANWISRMALP
ncbi:MULTISPECIES: deoxyribodipyrimidine photo-lyase [unclassified Corynebacterium]|uniref:deoxyribodipyrimidine photo-lyase n=2 Tax=Corynebacterium TaxID=1716 RepID=UPI0033073201